MVDFGESDKMIKISGKMDNQILIKSLEGIFHSLFKNFYRLNIVFSFSTFEHMRKKILKSISSNAKM